MTDVMRAAKPDATAPVAVLSETESWNLLASVALGRLITSVDGEPEVFPVNFVVQDRTVLFRTAEGTKLVSAAINNNVVFEADDHNVAEGWSVIVRGIARTLRTDDEVRAAESRLDVPRLVAEGVDGATLESFEFPAPSAPRTDSPVRSVPSPSM